MNYVVKNFLRGLAIVVPFTVPNYVVYQLLLWLGGSSAGRCS